MYSKQPMHWNWWRMPEFWEKRFLAYELRACAAIVVLLGLWMLYGDGTSFVEAVLKQNRGAVYGTLASILGALLGFTITTVTIVIAFSTDRSMARLRASSQYPTMWRVLTSTMRWLGVATMATLGGLLLDRDAAPRPIVFLGITFFVLVAVARLCRTGWVLERLLQIIVEKQKG